MAISKSDARKGIKTNEGKKMAEKKFQLDENKADEDKDGEISAYEKTKGEAKQKVAVDKDLDAGGLDQGSLVEKSIDALFSPTGMSVGLAPAAGILANATGADKKIYKALFDDAATWMGNDRGPIISGASSENKGKFYKNIASKGAKALLKLGVPLSAMMPDEIADGTMSDEQWEKFGVSDNEDVEMYAGGLMTDSMGCGCGGSMCTCGMGVTVGYDEESGNPIPAGSSAENVKDDISAALSTGEYVLPADVVRWHGLKHIQYMMDEAKMGLMSMHSEGQIADIDTDDTEEDEEEEDIETPEGNEVEVAEVDVEIEEMELDEEDEDDEDYAKKPSLPGYTSTPTVVYMKS